ncbi:MAG TPA: hypothetical protein VEP29_06020, partial [Desulfatiglandales bacterium]|nr:hypothetical protein [Desulfatiglandales bacterium]
KFILIFQLDNPKIFPAVGRFRPFIERSVFALRRSIQKTLVILSSYIQIQGVAQGLLFLELKGSKGL